MAPFPVAAALHFIPVTIRFGLRSKMLGEVYSSVEHGAKAIGVISRSSVPIAEKRDFHMSIKTAPPANSSKPYMNADTVVLPSSSRCHHHHCLYHRCALCAQNQQCYFKSI